VLYVLAARASSGNAQAADWLVGSAALVCAFLPLALRGAKASRRVSAVALMGTGIALALASGQSSELWLGRLHDLAWLVVVSIALGLALPVGVRRSMRVGAAGGFVSAALLGALAASSGLVPLQTFGVVVVAGLLVTGALHQFGLTGRGHAVEGGLSAIGIVILAVGLAYAWFGPLQGTLASVVEAGVGLLLWLAHLAWVDPRWRWLRRTGVPVLVASAAVFFVVYLSSPAEPLAPWEQGARVVVAALLWWVLYSAANRLSHRTVWSTSEELVEVARSARHALRNASDLDEVAIAALEPLSSLSVDAAERPEIMTFEPPLRVRLASGARVEIRSAEPHEAIVRAVGNDSSLSTIDFIALEARVVRDTTIRELVRILASRGIGAVVPCVRTDHLEGLLVLPLGGRSEPLTALEHEALRRLGRALGAALSSSLVQRRAQSHIHQVSELHRSAKARVSELESEVEQLRGQCDVLGRGLFEDQSLHVAYSPSMRRVQTRGIELAAGAEPMLLSGASGSPLLQVARFIHDRGPRWEAPFIMVDCAATEPEEAMARLFGSEENPRGWLDSASGGTVFLRDLPALPLEVQRRLAELLRDASSSPRVVATVRTTQDERDPRLGIDSDLARRLEEHTLEVPSLRERREDVPSLVLLAVDRACRVLARDPVGIDQAAMAALVDHDWPGDVAELDLVIQLAVARVRGRTIGVSDLPPLAWTPSPLEEALDGSYLEVERRLLEQALRASAGNKSEAARRLGLKRTTFLDKLRRHGLEKWLGGDVGGSAVG
jgi:DNA-binding NtrC family response regulator